MCTALAFAWVFADRAQFTAARAMPTGAKTDAT